MGEAPGSIAKLLNNKGIITPSGYQCFKRHDLFLETEAEKKGWTSGTICKILSNPVYTGDMVQGKSSKLSFKSKITLSTPKKDWIVVKNKHEPIVSRELFQLAGRRCISRKIFKSSGFFNAFSGLVYCGDCKRAMTTTGAGQNENRKLVCSGYKQYGKRVCTNHYMDYYLLCQIVTQELTSLIHVTEEEKRELITALEEYGKSMNKPEELRAAAALKKREREIDRIIGTLYEDRVKGTVEEDRFCKLLATYEQEQSEVRAETAALSQINAPMWKNREDSEDDVDLLLNEITNNRIPSLDLLHQFIDRIDIFQSGEDPHQKEKQFQTIRICYRTAPPGSKKA
ncbi:recombinase family protein [Clostridium boliviensis]|uniref:Recombinase family protein n=1 Tax=Clostridium boliviensis TaxID=318465 RepID=A0ABU4GSV3_9CLOT|nr:recombinase family protein [Clostridium boliviensis]MDW2800070.1 recombinase family protein [Clostridium boliviensis]